MLKGSEQRVSPLIIRQICTYTGEKVARFKGTFPPGVNDKKKSSQIAVIIH